MNDTELRWRLRQLPRELAPSRDLWPGIEGRLRQAPAAAAGQARFRRPLRALAALAAACLCLAVALALVPRPGPVPAESAEARMLQREADALVREYQAALAQFEGAQLPAPLEPTLATLDRSAEEIRRAIAADPESGFLIERLRHTYARRLSLTQRAVTG